MKLTEDVYLVGGGDYGFNLTHRLDCHTYLIDGGDELVLVDAGLRPGHRRDPRPDPGRRLRPGARSRDRDHPLPRRPCRRRAGAQARHRGGAVGADARRADRSASPTPTRSVSTGRRRSASTPRTTSGSRARSSTSSPTATGSRPASRAGGDLDAWPLQRPLRAAARRARPHLPVRIRLVFWGGAIILQNVPGLEPAAYAASMNRIARARVGRAPARPPHDLAPERPPARRGGGAASSTASVCHATCSARREGRHPCPPMPNHIPRR